MKTIFKAFYVTQGVFYNVTKEQSGFSSSRFKQRAAARIVLAE